MPFLLGFYFTEDLLRVPLLLNYFVYFTLQICILFIHFVDIGQVLFSIFLCLKDTGLLRKLLCFFIK